MSKGGWARLSKQQQESTPSQSQEGGAYQVTDGAHQLHKYKNIHISSGHEELAAHPPQSMHEIKASKLLQILKRWKAQSAAKPVPPRSHRSTTSSPSCSVPFSCITFSSIQLYSDHEEEEEEGEGGDCADDGRAIGIASDASSKTMNTPAASPLHIYSSTSAAAQTDGPSRQPTMKIPQCLGKGEGDLSCEIRKVRPAARRALSCPMLIRSPLRSCTASPSMYDSDVLEELERLQPKHVDEEGRNTKLRRSASSPLRRMNASKHASTPKGYLALYVGEERRRFLVKANVLNHPLFSVLLEKAKEEFGFDQKGPLNIPCEIAFFQHIMFLVESNHKGM